MTQVQVYLSNDNAFQCFEPDDIAEIITEKAQSIVIPDYQNFKKQNGISYYLPFEGCSIVGFFKETEDSLFGNNICERLEYTGEDVSLIQSIAEYIGGCKVEILEFGQLYQPLQKDTYELPVSLKSIPITQIGIKTISSRSIELMYNLLGSFGYSSVALANQKCTKLEKNQKVKFNNNLEKNTITCLLCTSNKNIEDINIADIEDFFNNKSIFIPKKCKTRALSKIIKYTKCPEDIFYEISKKSFKNSDTLKTTDELCR